MNERVVRKNVTFAHAFQLAGVRGDQPPGVYQVETVEEQLLGLSFVAYRRLSTTIELHVDQRASASRQLTTIDPTDLVAALEQDERTSNAQSSV